MEVATYLLFFLGLLGGTDILLFHSIAHGIRQHVPARTELVVHSLRGPVYAALFLIVPNFVLAGAYWWMLAALLSIDLLITVADFVVERRSRELLGGLPTGEYMLHLFMAVLFGALLMALWSATSSWAHAATRIAFAPADVPWILRLVLAVMACLVLASGILDAVAARRLFKTPRDTRVQSGGLPAG